MRARLRPLVVVVMSVAVVAGAWKLLFPSASDYVVRGEFTDAGGLTKNSDVKIGGVKGGRIENIELTDRDTAIVTMGLDDRARPIGRGAAARSRPVNLLGEKFVDLDPGDMKHPLPSGSRIPAGRTSRAVELDDVLNALDPDTRARLRIMINEAGVALMGRGTDMDSLLAQLPSALDRTQDVVGDLGRDNRALAALIDQSDRVIGAMAKRTPALQQLVDNASGTLRTTASRRRELGDTVRSAPAALRQLQATLTELETTAAGLRPAAAEVRRTAGPLNSTLKRLPAFADAAHPTLARLRSVSPRLATLGRRATPTVRRLRPTAERLDEFSRELRPLVAALDRGAFQSALELVDGWARTIAKTDGLGHVFGLRTTFDQQIVSNLVDRYTGGSGARSKAKARSKARTRSKGRAPSNARPPSRGRTPSHARPPSHAGAPSPAAPPAQAAPPSGAGGGPQAAPRPVDDLLDYLLGP